MGATVAQEAARLFQDRGISGSIPTPSSAGTLATIFFIFLQTKTALPAITNNTPLEDKGFFLHARLDYQLKKASLLLDLLIRLILRAHSHQDIPRDWVWLDGNGKKCDGVLILYSANCYHTLIPLTECCDDLRSSDRLRWVTYTHCLNHEVIKRCSVKAHQDTPARIAAKILADLPWTCH